MAAAFSRAAAIFQNGRRFFPSPPPPGCAAVYVIEVRELAGRDGTGQVMAPAPIPCFF